MTIRSTLKTGLAWAFASAVLLVAASAHSFATTLSSNYEEGTLLVTGDTVTVDVYFDTSEEADEWVGISLLSVSVLFDEDLFSWDQGASSSPVYALYASGGKANYYLVPATSNLTIRTGTSNQILLDWQNSSLPGGNRNACGWSGRSGYGCGFQMASLVFAVQLSGSGYADFALSNNSFGNLLQLADGSQPENAVSGDFSVPLDDEDGVSSQQDNCPATFNPDQADGDTDGVGDVCDNCVAASNADQSDIDGDDLGDVCDPDRDGDLVPNDFDPFPDCLLYTSPSPRDS